MYRPLPNVKRARREQARIVRWNNYWARYGQCWYCREVHPRFFFYGDGLGRAVCWGCWADGKGYTDHR
jgi:hypothetical protein